MRHRDVELMESINSYVDEFFFDHGSRSLSEA